MPGPRSNKRPANTLASVNEKLLTMEKYMQGLAGEFKSLRNSITGSEEFGQWGYRHRIERLEERDRKTDKRVTDIENKLNKAAAYAVGIGSAVGFLTGLLGTVITNIDKIKMLFGG